MAHCELSATQCKLPMSMMNLSTPRPSTRDIADMHIVEGAQCTNAEETRTTDSLLRMEIPPLFEQDNAVPCFMVRIYMVFWEDCTLSLSSPGNARSVLVPRRLLSNGQSDDHYIYIYKYTSVAQRIRGQQRCVLTPNPDDAECRK